MPTIKGCGGAVNHVFIVAGTDLVAESSAECSANSKKLILQGRLNHQNGTCVLF